MSESTRSLDLLRILVDTFGEESHKVNQVFERYDQILVNEADPISQKIAQSYLEWCVAHPARIGQRKQFHDCRLNCEFGWLSDGSKEGTHRPCPNCLPGAHDQWVSDFQNINEDESDGMV